MMEQHESLKDFARTLTFRRMTPAQWRMWKAAMRNKPQWFILRRPNTRGARWQAVAGPYCTPEAAYSDLIRLNRPERDKTTQSLYRWQVASLTETMRIYHNNVPQLVDDLAEAERLMPAPGPARDEQARAS